ncbi:MAG: T9SS C-terminal target domain-containing protein, partial [Bacteroidetes bacterium]
FLVTVFFTLGSVLSTTTLSGQNLLQNPGFETGSFDPWFDDNGNGINITTDAAEGNYAAVGNVAQFVTLEEGVEYELRCKARILTASADQKIWVGIRAPSAFLTNTEVLQTDWQDMAIDFTAPESGDHKFWIWGQGNSTYASDSWTLVVKGTTGVNDQEAKEKIKITRNAEGVAIDMTTVASDAKILVHDFAGRLVYQTTTNQSDNLIENSIFHTSGIYIVSVITDKLHRVEKVAMMGL